MLHQALHEQYESMTQKGHWVVVVYDIQQTQNAPFVCLAHTIGLAARGMPELALLVNMPMPVAYQILESAAAWFVEHLCSGERMKDGGAIALGDTAGMIFRITPDLVDNVFEVALEMGVQVPSAFQLVLVDEAGRLPWQPGFNAPYQQMLCFNPPAKNLH